MTERERLLAILNEPIFPHAQADPLEAVADYLLGSGVTIPVRCKDCKHYKNAEGCKPLCQKFEGLYGYPKEDDFCSYGERKTDENT